MIVVLADDLTGAAELGGIGVRHGLSVEVNMDVPASVKADLLVIAANTRSMGEKEAVAVMERLTGQLMVLRPEWIYKKADSVLRGHVAAEIGVQLKVSGLDSALLVPANPALGRTIKDGQYFLHGRPIHESSFRMDPEFAMTSYRIEDMLRSQVYVKKPGDELPGSGIIVGEAVADEDLDVWAGIAGKSMLPAGAAGFFSALLLARRGKAMVEKGEATMNRGTGMAEKGHPILFVSGTTFDKNRAIIRKIRAAGGPVYYIDDAGAYEHIVHALQYGRKAIVAVEEREAAAHILRERMADLVSRVFAAVHPGELVIEGGATAYAILSRVGLRVFFPEEELAPGIVRMRAAGAGTVLHVAVKPGSYEWPAPLRKRLEY